MEEREYQVTFGQLMRIILKHWWIMLISAVLIAVLAFTYVNFFVTPKYTSSATVGLRITSDSVSASYQDTMVGKELAKEGEIIITSNRTLSLAADKLNAYFEAEGGNPYRSSEYTWKDIKSMIKTSTSGESRFFDVKVTSTNPKEAQIVCQAVVEAFSEILNPNERKADIIGYPEAPTAPSSPNKMLAVVLGAFVGALLSFAVLLIVHFSKDEIDGEDWIVNTYKDKIPVLAVIPDAGTAARAYKKYGYRYGYDYK